MELPLFLTLILDVVDQIKRRRAKSSEKVDETPEPASMETDEPSEPLSKERLVDFEELR